MPDHPEQITRLRTANKPGILKAVRSLDAGEVVAIPTETVYGLGADAANGTAVARIYAAKGRPAFNPLIVHVADLPMAERYAIFSPLAHRLATQFWPGPLTLVLPRHPEAKVASLALAGLATIALRVPSHPVMQQLLQALGRGIAAPSANRSGRISPTRAEHVLDSLGGRIPLILDGGPCANGIESTIVAVDGEQAHLLRLGAVATTELESIVGQTIPLATMGDPVQAPGMTPQHYAPRLPLRLHAATAAADEFHLGFGQIAGDANLSPSGSSIEAAAQLYAMLHQADASGRRGIAVAPIPNDGLGAAINDRLGRAAS